MKPCWSCGAQDEPCFEGCACAKCLDPDRYKEWTRNNPEAYYDWLQRQTTDEDALEDYEVWIEQWREKVEAEDAYESDDAYEPDPEVPW
jgi:hypothetical protein